MTFTAIVTLLACAIVGLAGLTHAARSSRITTELERGAHAAPSTVVWRLFVAAALAWLIGDGLQDIVGDGGWVLAMLVAYLVVRTMADADDLRRALNGREGRPK